MSELDAWLVLVYYVAVLLALGWWMGCGFLRRPWTQWLRRFALARAARRLRWTEDSPRPASEGDTIQSWGQSFIVWTSVPFSVACGALGALLVRVVLKQFGDGITYQQSVAVVGVGLIIMVLTLVRLFALFERLDPLGTLLRSCANVIRASGSLSANESRDQHAMVVGNARSIVRVCDRMGIRTNDTLSRLQHAVQDGVRGPERASDIAAAAQDVFASVVGGRWMPGEVSIAQKRQRRGPRFDNSVWVSAVAVILAAVITAILGPLLGASH